MTAEQLRSVYAKMAWARGHFHALDAEIAAWIKDDAHRIVYETNEDLTQHYLRAVFGSQPRHDRWPLMIGDTVTNLRDTLDHLIFAVAHLPESPRPDKADAAAFPIGLTLAKFNESKQRLLALPDLVRQSVLSFQPFNRPNKVRPPLLAILAELANGSKHKLLSVVLTQPEFMDVKFVSDGKIEHTSMLSGLHKDGITEGKPFFVIETVPDPNFRLESGEIHFGVSIAHSSLPGETLFDAGHTPYRILLQQLFDEVEHIINTIIPLV